MGRSKTSANSKVLNLRAGEWIEVRGADEILETLDQTQALEGLPFMPEMLQYCGGRFRVYKIAHKTCDTVKDYNIRRMTHTVHLEGLRCDGVAHGGCQAACLLYWKEVWLKRASSADETMTSPVHSSDVASSVLLAGTHSPPIEGDTKERFRCQATDLLKFTTEVRRRHRWDPRFYLKDLSSGNVTLSEFIRYGVFAMFNAFVARWFGWRYPHLCGTASGKTPAAKLNLQPSEMVQVRSRNEIMQTLGPNLKNRGLHFDVEMVPYCESTHRVLTRVEKIVDEKTGYLVELPNPCLILEGVSCRGMLSSSRMFCPRNIYPFWREVWLKRVSETDGAPAR